MAEASWRNGRQVVWSRYSPAFRAVVARRVQTVVDATSERLILLTGSCGLQLANDVWTLLRLPVSLRMDVIALGPACFDELRSPAVVVQGRGDGWSRLFYRGRVDHHCECGHLEYWESHEARKLVSGVLR